ncbi:hypothetical protein P691DRAFT_213464 [Macrolepiota fuliginosa MF-IS2]|uniref:Uncharacterized protein n=1 Tax=Macrolepiota fuliginosa MF-IS2 TaxID=1400762 RepID=A0A9P5X869_9AGAR|nr:hypothetical protein P691DRAFT_213464 [Macrolepiota fuliginosa MF-IS2]
MDMSCSNRPPKPFLLVSCLVTSTLIEPREPFYSRPLTAGLSDLRTLESLTPLRGHILTIHASSFLHLCSTKRNNFYWGNSLPPRCPQRSIIFGSHGGRAVKGLRTEVINARGGHSFCHSPESWKELWDGEIFEKGSVRIEAKLIEHERRSTDQPGIIYLYMIIDVIDCYISIAYFPRLNEDGGRETLSSERLPVQIVPRTHLSDSECILLLPLTCKIMHIRR